MARPEGLPHPSEAGLEHGKAIGSLVSGDTPPDVADHIVPPDHDDPFGGLPTLPMEAFEHFPQDEADFMPGGKLLQVIDDLFGA